jgi:PEP-CTERM motif
MRRSVLCACLLLVALSGVHAFADLNGANVTVNYIYPNIGTIYQVLGTGTVTGGGFTVNSFGQHDFTTYPTDITLTNVLGQDVMFIPASFNGYQLVVNSGGSAITGFSVAFNDIAGFVPSDVSFDATDVWINLQGLTTTPGLDLQLDLNFGSTVPEPGTLIMFGSGVLGLAGMLRRKINL